MSTIYKVFGRTQAEADYQALKWKYHLAIGGMRPVKVTDPPRGRVYRDNPSEDTSLSGKSEVLHQILAGEKLVEPPSLVKQFGYGEHYAELRDDSDCDDSDEEPNFVTVQMPAPYFFPPIR